MEHASTASTESVARNEFSTYTPNPASWGWRSNDEPNMPTVARPWIEQPIEMAMPHADSNPVPRMEDELIHRAVADPLTVVLLETKRAPALLDVDEKVNAVWLETATVDPPETSDMSVTATSHTMLAAVAVAVQLDSSIRDESVIFAPCVNTPNAPRV